MELSEALHGISQRRYYEICGRSYRSLKHGGHGNMTWQELPQEMKLGVLDLINGIYRVQKMVYSYDIYYLNHCMKSCGIQLKAFFAKCDFPPSFVHHYTMSSKCEDRLARIKLELLRLINRLFAYVLQ